MQVYEAVTSDAQVEGFSYIPMEEEQYEQAQAAPVQDGQMLARVTDRTPGKSCAYEMRARKFTLYWSAEFREVQGECQMTMTETYEFAKDAVIPYLLSVLFIRQKQQHKEYFRTIHDRLKLKEFRENSSRSLKQL